MIFLLVSKLDPKTKHDWEMTLGGNVVPTFDQLVRFLEWRYRALEINGKSSSLSNNNTNKIIIGNNSRLVHNQHDDGCENGSCRKCGRVHHYLLHYKNYQGPSTTQNTSTT